MKILNGATGEITDTMKMLELFAGKRSIGSIAEEQMDVLSLEIEKKFKCNLTMDILDFDPVQFFQDTPPDFIWASPDCSTYSVAALGFHRDGIHPKTERRNWGIC